MRFPALSTRPACPARLRFALAATIVAASSQAQAQVPAGTASAAISHVQVSLVALDAEPWVTNMWPWIVQNIGPGWPAQAEATGVDTALTDASLHDGSVGWIGADRGATVGSARAAATAGISFSGADLFSTGAAWSSASASAGEVATASARLWDAPFMVGARTRVVLTLTVDGLSATGAGGTASALVSLGIWDAFAGSHAAQAEAQVIDSPDFSLGYDGPLTLSVSWDNPSQDVALAQVSLLTSAQVLSAALAPVPEPATPALLLAGLAGIAMLTRRRNVR